MTRLLPLSLTIRSRELSIYSQLFYCSRFTYTSATPVLGWQTSVVKPWSLFLRLLHINLEEKYRYSALWT